MRVLERLVVATVLELGVGVEAVRIDQGCGRHARGEQPIHRGVGGLLAAPGFEPRVDGVVRGAAALRAGQVGVAHPIGVVERAS